MILALFLYCLLQGTIPFVSDKRITKTNVFFIFSNVRSLYVRSKKKKKP